MAITTTIANFNSDALRASAGYFFYIRIDHHHFCDFNVFNQHKRGFWVFVYADALIIFINPIISYIAMKKYVNIGYFDVQKAIIKPFICTIIMGIISYILKNSLNSIAGNIFSITISALVYILTVFLISRRDFYKFINLVYKKVS